MKANPRRIALQEYVLPLAPSAASSRTWADRCVETMIADAGVKVIYPEKPNRAPGKGVKLNGRRIESLTTLSGRTDRIDPLPPGPH